MAVEDVVIDGIHLFENFGLEILLTTLAADSSGNIVNHHEVIIAAIIVVDLFLGYLASTISAIGINANVLPPLVLGLTHFGNVGL